MSVHNDRSIKRTYDEVAEHRKEAERGCKEDMKNFGYVKYPHVLEGHFNNLPLPPKSVETLKAVDHVTTDLFVSKDVYHKPMDYDGKQFACVEGKYLYVSDRTMEDFYEINVASNRSKWNHEKLDLSHVALLGTKIALASKRDFFTFDIQNEKVVSSDYSSLFSRVSLIKWRDPYNILLSTYKGFYALDLREKRSTVVSVESQIKPDSITSFIYKDHQVLAGLDSHKIVQMDLRKNEVVKTYQGHEGSVLGLEWDYEMPGRFLSCGGLDKTVKIWSIHKETPLYSRNTQAQVLGLSHLTGNKYLTTQGFSKDSIETDRLHNTLHVWELRNEIYNREGLELKRKQSFPLLDATYSRPLHMAKSVETKEIVVASTNGDENTLLSRYLIEEDKENTHPAMKHLIGKNRDS